MFIVFICYSVLLVGASVYSFVRVHLRGKSLILSVLAQDLGCDIDKDTVSEQSFWLKKDNASCLTNNDCLHFMLSHFHFVIHLLICLHAICACTLKWLSYKPMKQLVIRRDQ